MKKAVAVVVSVCSACSVANIVGPTPVEAQQSVVITHATVIDATSPTPRTEQTIVTRGGKIVAVGPTATTARPPGARQIDANGRFVIPGLWDMHVHLDVPEGRALLSAYIVNGVTGVRDMVGDWDTLSGWRRDIAAGKLIGPRIYASGPYLEGNPQPLPNIQVRNPADARRGVDSLKKLGVDFVKFHTGLSRESFFAAARRARELNFPFAGHVPRSISAIEASDSGMRSLEHMLTIPTPCTRAESISLAPRFPVQRVLGPCSSEPLDPIWRTLAKNHTWITPTYTAAVEIAEWPKRDLPGDAYAKYLPDTLKKFVLAIFPMPDSIPPDAHLVGRQMFNKRLALAPVMYRAGVPLLAGTDSPLRNSPPGFGLLEELALFATGGLTPFEVLKVATWEPASYFNILSTAGTVEAGKDANLVILDKNPLADVANYRTVSSVVAAGRLYTAADRKTILAQLEAASKKR